MMNHNIPQEVIDKIQKCLNLSQNPNENEAAVAASKAQELLIKYNLSLSDIQTKDDKVEEQTFDDGVTGYDAWKINLMSTVVRCNYCHLLLQKVYGGKKIFYLIGKPHNITVAKNIYSYLVEATEKLWSENRDIMKEYPTGQAKRRARDSFKRGVCSNICSRLWKRKDQIEKEGMMDAGSQCTALAVVDSYKKAKAENDQFVNDKYRCQLKSSRAGGASVDGAAYGHGYAKGNSIGLDTQIGRSQAKQVGR